jgi:hypothetical protein
MTNPIHFKRRIGRVRKVFFFLLFHFPHASTRPTQQDSLSDNAIPLGHDYIFFVSLCLCGLFFSLCLRGNSFLPRATFRMTRKEIMKNEEK